jgi:hypothetical protein
MVAALRGSRDNHVKSLRTCWCPDWIAKLVRCWCGSWSNGVPKLVCCWCGSWSNGVPKLIGGSSCRSHWVPELVCRCKWPLSVEVNHLMFRVRLTVAGMWTYLFPAQLPGAGGPLSRRWAPDLRFPNRHAAHARRCPTERWPAQRREGLGCPLADLSCVFTHE